MSPGGKPLGHFAVRVHPPWQIPPAQHLAWADRPLHPPPAQPPPIAPRQHSLGQCRPEPTFVRPAIQGGSGEGKVKRRTENVVRNRRLVSRLLDGGEDRFESVGFEMIEGLVVGYQEAKQAGAFTVGQPAENSDPGKRTQKGGTQKGPKAIVSRIRAHFLRPACPT